MGLSDRLVGLSERAMGLITHRVRAEQAGNLPPTGRMAAGRQVCGLLPLAPKWAFKLLISSWLAS